MYYYTTPSSCSSSGQSTQSPSPVYNAASTIIPLLILFAYALNAIALSIVARKRGNHPCAWFFMAVIFNVWAWACLLGCTSKKPAPSSVVPITASINSMAFVPPLMHAGHGYHNPPPGMQLPQLPYPPPLGYGHPGGGYTYPQPAAYGPSYSPQPQFPPSYAPQTPANIPAALPHSSTYVTTPAPLPLPPNPYGVPVYSQVMKPT